jgi:spore coat polysaccharide biosynthesis protein SpsF
MIGCIIQARMGSTRLPGKVMKKLDLQNYSLDYTINQLNECPSLKKIIIATTMNPEDDVIENFANEKKINIFRGDSEDVLSRYYHCAKTFSLDSIIRVTGDCPLIDPKIVEKGIKIYLKENCDYLTNTSPRTFPDGNETEIFSFSALTNAFNNATLPSEREHVTPYFRNNPKDFRIYNFTNNEDISNLRWTLDYDIDLKLIKIIISKIQTRPIHMNDILDLFAKEPQLKKINQDHKPNEGYLRSLKNDEEYLRKKTSP